MTEHFPSQQIWKCVTCKTTRQWGHGVPADKKRRRLLICLGECNRGLDGKLPPIEECEHTKHVYFDSFYEKEKESHGKEATQEPKQDRSNLQDSKTGDEPAWKAIRTNRQVD